MKKYIVSCYVGGGDTKGKEAIIVVSTNNPGPTFKNGEGSVFSTIVLVVGTTLVCVVSPYGSMMVMVGITLASAINPCGSW